MENRRWPTTTRHAGRTPPPGLLPVARRAWRAGEENKALAEGYAAMLILPLAAIALGLVVLIGLAIVLFAVFALSR